MNRPIPGSAIADLLSFCVRAYDGWHNWGMGGPRGVGMKDTYIHTPRSQSEALVRGWAEEARVMLTEEDRQDRLEELEDLLLNLTLEKGAGAEALEAAGLSCP